MWIYLAIFIIGSIIGSFLNVVICRLPEKRSIVRGRSMCPHCKEVIGILDLIPIVSFIILLGRCRKCRKKISWQYPLVELITGLLFVLVAYWYRVDLNLANVFFFRDLIFTAALLTIFVTDLRFYLIFDAVTIPMMFFAVIINLFLFGNSANFLLILGYMALSALVGGGFFYFQHRLSRGQWVGAGDIRLGFLLGLMLGWPSILLALLLAYISGAIISLFLLLFRIKTMKSQIQFGVFLTTAAFITLIFGEAVIGWYLSLFI